MGGGPSRPPPLLGHWVISVAGKQRLGGDGKGSDRRKVGRQHQEKGGKAALGGSQEGSAKRKAAQR